MKRSAVCYTITIYDYCYNLVIIETVPAAGQGYKIMIHSLSRTAYRTSVSSRREGRAAPTLTRKILSSRRNFSPLGTGEPLGLYNNNKTNQGTQYCLFLVDEKSRVNGDVQLPRNARDAAPRFEMSKMQAQFFSRFRTRTEKMCSSGLVRCQAKN